MITPFFFEIKMSIKEEYIEKEGHMTIPKHLLELTANQVYIPCQLSEKDLTALSENHLIIGQERAMEAISFGIQMEANGYNIFCTGPKGVGRTSLSLEVIRQYAVSQKTPDDWCFVHNFEVPHQPIALNFPAGKGRIFERDIKKVAQALRTQVTNAFLDENYRIKIAHIEQKYRSDKEAFFTMLQQLVESKNVTLTKTENGVVVGPVKNGELLTPEVFNKLPKAQRKSILEQMQEAQKKLEKAIKDTPDWEAKQQEEINQINTELMTKITDGVLKNLRKTYAKHAGVVTFLKGISQSLIDAISILLPSGGNDDAIGEQIAALWSHYAVNLIVSRKPNEGAPVIHVNHPTLSNLIGKIERVQLQGTLTTDFSLIRPGALHLANGGYLVIEARDLLENPPTWNALKRCLFSKKIKMESGIDDNSIFGVISQDPMPIPLNVKVVLIGEPALYYALAEQDDEFSELFKIQSRFAEKMIRSHENEQKYAQLLANFIRSEHLKPFSSAAIFRMIEQASRWANDQQKLSTYLVHANDLMRESNFIALQEKAKFVDIPHIEKALLARQKRLGAAQSELMEAIQRGLISITTTGQQVGQINALVVHDFGTYSFGRPNRVTCQVRLGHGDFIDIEREVELGGPIHSKGVLILSSFLASRFAKKSPLSLDASLVFEQSYNEVDGDSASSAELYCLLSTIADIPLKQSLAVTGSVNQLGEIQAVGAVNEKIEGFFNVCKAKGLTGEQGVIIPATTQQNLMLNPEVTEAIQAGVFHIYAVKTVDEGMEILTGLKAGKQNKNGVYPKNTINGRVADCLDDYIKLAQKYNATLTQSKRK